MKNQNKELSKQLQLKLKEVKKVISKHFIAKYVTIHEEPGTVSFPGGIIIPSDDISSWLLSLDFDWLENTNDDSHGVFSILTVLSVVRDLSTLLPNLELDTGYYPIFDNDGNFVDTLSNNSILEEMQESDLFYSAAKAVLEREIIEKNSEKSE